MTISATSGVGSAGANSTLSLQDFLQVLMTQLTYQDPLKPMDNEQFMAQIAQFTTLEETQQMNASIQTLVSNQAVQQTVGLIGHTVNFTTQSGPLSGTVQSIDLSGSTPQLSIKTSTGVVTGVSIGQLTSVQ
ncbi:flagellar hook capping FlgD N-terminal domain-containing protein [Trinickia diaoshuihuensis]|uniref:flagellar hook capping FlgD N-terminal domain-containing protein n=1 Tax=Trinickia diaoshuihuensis TaxID=2292265 RepID=UPI000E23B816|nr:flagellar hook capping FlgD N-terminal domain-containing protein [Trinickia diaoshuihuensis]